MFSFKKTISLGLSALVLSASLSTIVRAEKNFTPAELPSQEPYSWVQNGGATSAAISIQEFNGRMYQAIRGNSSPYKIYIRSTADGVFDDSDGGESWDATGVAGNTSSQVAMSALAGKLYVAVRGNSGNIFTKGMTTEGVWDEAWNENGGATSRAVAMTTATFTAEQPRLYQAIRGNSTSNIYIRFTEDGVFNGGTGENWELVSGQTPNEIALGTLAENKLILSIRGNSGEIWNRYTTDGVFDGEEGEDFVQNGGKTSLAPTLTMNNGVIYQMVKGNSSDAIYTRASFDGIEWTDWVNRGGATQTRPGMGAAFGKVYQAVRGNSGQIFTRQFANLVSFVSENEPWSFDYFDFYGAPTNINHTADVCTNGDGLESLSWETTLSVFVGSNCAGGGGGDLTLLKTTYMDTRDGKAVTLQVLKNNSNNTYMINGSSSEGNGLQLMMQSIPTYAQALLSETEARAIFSTLEYTPTPMIP